jgi:uncharacterized protein YycO
MVCLLTCSEFSHVDYIFDNGAAYSSLPSTGVDYNSDKNDIEQWYELEVPQKIIVENFILKQRGKPYDYMGIVGFLFNRTWQEDDKWFCSELIAAAIEYSGLPLFNKRVSRITPRDLYTHHLLKKIDNPESNGNKIPKII